MTRPNFLRFPVWHIVFAQHIRIALLSVAAGTIAFLCLYGAYSGGKYIAELHGEAVGLRSDNQAAMAILSGARYEVDGDAYRLEEVKQKQLIGGL